MSRSKTTDSLVTIHIALYVQTIIIETSATITMANSSAYWS